MKRVIVLAFALGLSGCDDQINADSVQGFNLSKPLEFTVHTFSTPLTEGGSAINGTAANGIASADAAYCFLNRVSGDFAGAAEGVRLTNAGGKWSLTGQAQSNGVSAQAVCVPKYSFAMKDDKKPSLIAAVSNNAWNTGCEVQSAPTGAGAGKAFFISGLKGGWDGGGEGLAVSAASFHVRGCSGGAGGFVSSYVLRPDGGAVRYWTPSGPTTNADVATLSLQVETPAAPGWWDAFMSGPATSGAGPPPPRQLAPVNEAVCGLVGVSGKFRGSGEFVEVLPQGGHWVLRIGNLQDNGFVNAAARCVLREQRDPA